MRVVGIDLAWGDRKPDGLAPVEASRLPGDLHTGFIVVPKRDGAVGDAWTTS